MQTYDVRAVDGKTGEEKRYEIEADDERQAVKAVRKRGDFVSQIKPTVTRITATAGGPAVSPGYVVSGVDRESGLDTQVTIEAESESNAKVKAELMGVIVTSINGSPVANTSNHSVTSTVPMKSLSGPVCQVCGHGMKATTKVTTSASGIAFGALLLLIGLFVLIAGLLLGLYGLFTFNILLYLPVVIMVVLGGVISVASLFMGGKRKNVWRCTNCSAIIERA